MSDHPTHTTTREIAPGIWEPAKQAKPRWYVAWRKVRACRKAGGHWWHPEQPGWSEWYCCDCPATASGAPQDGTPSWQETYPLMVAAAVLLIGIAALGLVI